ncbi:hypothetical protein M446_3332 [Methylobacterium sp. 4-46]|uniref:hypothetical protein n=1 Tax=unclassified Methylobacterium TaxID=2615210 RepID=UPI000152E5D4|nr:MULTISPECIES: hypothetical protein [Methylobacterium]ACA17734.1 hypothetical protein M446_3332 [Methylobacterium sp. 4-46]WFT83403.1 hypothetical protein QA634_16890 [Methylobacterium nodulans]
MSDADTPQVSFTVEVGPHVSPLMKVHAGGRVIPIALTAAQAGELGRALLAVSAVCSSTAPHPEGTRVDNCHFPVEAWAAGQSQSNGLPILLIQVTGGTQLALQFSPTAAEQCAASLAGAAAARAIARPS